MHISDRETCARNLDFTDRVSETCTGSWCCTDQWRKTFTSTATTPPLNFDQVKVYPYILFRATHVSTKEEGHVQHHVQISLVGNKYRSMVLHRSRVAIMREGIRFYRSLDGRRMCGIYVLQITSWETSAKDLSVTDDVSDSQTCPWICIDLELETRTGQWRCTDHELETCTGQ